MAPKQEERSLPAVPEDTAADLAEVFPGLSLAPERPK